MLVYVATPAVVTRKAFRDKEQAARFIASHASTFVKTINQYGRDREECARRRPTFVVAPQNWPKHLS